ncbi:MAG: hypothetical protein ACK59B_04685, partial [Alphaproteobacteria bacterium]
MSLWYWLLLGAGTWVLAIVLKVTADHYVQRSRLPVLQDWAAAILSGLWSSLCELQLFVLVLWFWSAGWLEALVAALGAGLAELLALMPAILSSRFGKQETTAIKKSTWKAIAIELSLHLYNKMLVM